MSRAITCPGCKASVPNRSGENFPPYVGTAEGCWQIYTTQVLVREYENYRLMGTIHRLSVDIYMAQHPGIPEPQSIQSVAVHLIGLHLVFNHGLSNEEIPALMQKALQRGDRFYWLEPPDFSTVMKATDVSSAYDVPSHEQLVERWAQEVWNAWSEHHKQISQWAFN